MTSKSQQCREPTIVHSGVVGKRWSYRDSTLASCTSPCDKLVLDCSLSHGYLLFLSLQSLKFRACICTGCVCLCVHRVAFRQGTAASAGNAPAEPQEKGAKDNKGDGMTWHVDRVSICIKSPDPRAQKYGAHQTGQASQHVDDTAASKIYHAHGQQPIGRGRRKPAAAGPHPAMASLLSAYHGSISLGLTEYARDAETLC